MIQPNGYFKLWRMLLTKPIWLNSTPEQKAILITLLAMANYKPNQWEWQGEKYECQPGQFITSLDKIAKACGVGISIRNIRTSLVRFEKLEFLTNESTKTGRRITIVNWGLYQSDDDKVTKKAAKTRQRPDKDLTTNEEGKKDKEIKNKDLYMDFVWLTMAEYQKLTNEYGTQKTQDMIERLNSYGHQKSKKFKEYTSHYHTIKSWIRKDGDTTKGKIPRAFQSLIDYKGSDEV